MRRRPVALLVLWALLAVTPLPLLAEAAFVVEDARIHLANGSYQLDATIDYRFTETALEALRNGVPLTVVVKVEVYRTRPFLWDERVAKLRLRYQLRYRALSQLYQVVNLGSGTKRNFASITAAIRALGTIRGLEAIDRGVLKPGGQYSARLRASLDIEALPLPLRPLAYVSPAWHLASKWYQWQPGS